jgi:hypothetical protein
VHRADNLAAFICLMYRNSGNLNLLEPQGPVQACTGIAYYVMHLYITSNKEAHSEVTKPVFLVNIIRVIVLQTCGLLYAVGRRMLVPREDKSI